MEKVSVKQSPIAPPEIGIVTHKVKNGGIHRMSMRSSKTRELVLRQMCLFVQEII